MPTQHELGKKTALSLIKEMRFLGKLKQDQSLDDLLDKVPNRDELEFQVISKLDAAKSYKAKGNFGAELAGLRFCVGDGSVERLKMMDIDHTVPFAYLRKKQIALLNYLNDPLKFDFKIGFLSIDDINDYFKEEAGIVKGSRRFFRLCYNDIDNLLLICHACNIDKGANDSLEWFRKQEPFLGELFVKAVNEAGGLHDGIIVKKVCKVASDLSDIVKIGEFECRLHDGEGNGLGEFVNDWFERENPEYNKGIIGAYSDIWLQLQEIWELQLKSAVTDDKAGKDAQTTANKLTVMLDAQIKTVEKHYKLLTKRGKEFPSVSQDSSEKSHSTTDSPEDRKVRIQLIDEDTKRLLKYIHAVKKIHSLIGNKDPNLVIFLKRDQFYEFLDTLNIRGHEQIVQKIIFDKVYTKLTSHYDTQPLQNLTVDEIKAIIKQAVLEENPLYGQLIEEREGRIAAEKRAASAEAKLADTHKWISSHSAADAVSAANPADLDIQTRDSSILHSFDKPYSSYNQATGTEKEKSESKESSAFQEVESPRSSFPEDPPAKRRSTTPPNRRPPSPSQ